MDASNYIPADVKPHDGQCRAGRHYFACRVYYEDTDFSGIVYHAAYLKFMERARSDTLYQLGMDQRASFEAGDCSYALADLHIKYIAPARSEERRVGKECRCLWS